MVVERQCLTPWQLFACRWVATTAPRTAVLTSIRAFLIILFFAVCPGPFNKAEAADQITGGCSVTATSFVLPNYDLVTKSQKDGTGALSVKCTGTGTANATVALSAGTGSCATRTMKSGTSVLNYNIYTSSAYTTVWCEPTRVTVTFLFNSPTTPQTLTQSVPMYARIPAAQNVAAGTYSDTVASTVFWSGGNSPAVSFTVQSSAPAACGLSVTNLNFGVYSGTAGDAQSSLSVTCSSSTAYSIALGSGANFSTTRRMSGASGQHIAYSLFSNSARTIAWGNGSVLGTTVSGTGSGTAQSFPVFGRTSVGAPPDPGTYSDSVIVTVAY